MNSKDFQAWDEYVDKHDEGSFFHLSGWYQVITDVFSHQGHYLLAEIDSKIVGILPLFEQKSKIFGHALISTPFCVYGGALADESKIKKALEQKAFELGCFLRVDYVELRDRYPQKIESPWVAHCQHATFTTDLNDSPETILTSVKRKQRAVIRHSLKNSLSWNNQNNLDDCYDIYAQSVRNLGSPVFHRQLFESLKSVFGERCETLVIADADGKAVSSVLSFYYKDVVFPYYGGGTIDARSLKSNDYMYYQLMCIAQDKGVTQFDFGRSKEASGSYHFKKNWGMNAEKLHYRIALVKAKQMPNLSPNNPKYKMFIQLWKKMPITLSRYLGPHLSKYLG